MEQIISRLEAIEKRLAALESNSAPADAEFAKPQASIVTDAYKASRPAGPFPKPISRPNYVLPANSSDNGPAINWMAVTGIFCLVLAAVYLIKLAIDNGWLTPERQVALAFAFGASLIVAGLRLAKTDRQYFSYLPAAGFTILFVAILGASGYHNILNPAFALYLCLLTSVATFATYSRIPEFIYVVVATVGTYFAPVLLGISTFEVNFIQLYFVLATATFTAIAALLESRPASLLSGYSALFLAAVSAQGPETQSFPTAAILAAHGLILTSGILYHSVVLRKPLESEQVRWFFPLVLFFYALEYHFLNKTNSNYAIAFSISFSIALLAIYFFVKNKLSEKFSTESKDLLLICSSIAAIHGVYFDLTPEIFQPALFLVVGMAVLAQIQKLQFRNDSQFFSFLKFAGIGLLAWNLLRIVSGQSSTVDTGLYIFYGFVYAGILLLIGLVAPKRTEEKDLRWLLFAPHLMMIFNLYSLLKPYGSLTVSIGWAAYSLLVLALGVIKRDKVFAKSSTVVFLFSTLKVFLYDLSDADGGLRVILLLLTGLLLYGAGWLFKQIEAWPTAE